MKGKFRSTEEEDRIFVPIDKVEEFDNLIDSFEKISDTQSNEFYVCCDKIDTFLDEHCTVFEGDLEDAVFDLVSK